MLLQGTTKAPWETSMDLYSGEVPVALTEGWKKACEVPFEDQVFLVTSQTANSESDILDWDSQKRILYVMRILEKLEIEDKKFKYLTDILIKTRS